MMRTLCAALTLFLLPLASMAEIIGIRSGDHESFTRLVFYFQEPPRWAVGRLENAYAFRTDNPDDGYDTSEVFARIARDRLANLQPVGETLYLDVVCDCHLQAFEVTPNIVAVDIVDGPGPVDNPFEAALPDDGVRLAASAPPPRPPLFGLTGASGRVGDAPSQPAVSLPLIVEPAAEAATGLLRPVLDDPRVSAIETRLFEDVARAATQGLLNPALPETPAPERAVALSDTDPMAHLGASTAFDLARGTAVVVTGEGSACLPDAAVDIGRWGGEGEAPDWGLLSAQRLAVIDARDRPDPEAAIRLAQMYLFTTFGAEARDVAETMAPGDPRTPVLATMAAILDEDPVPADSPLVGQADCPSAVALWSVLAADPPAAAAGFDRAAVVRTFSRLPLHLRRHLGPMLTDRLLVLGDEAGALALRDALDRAPGDHGDGFRMIEADLAREAGDTLDAIERLSEVVADGGPEVPEALSALFGLLREAGRVPSPALREVAGSLAYELGGTADGDALHLATILADAQSGDIDTALAALRRARWSPGGAATAAATADGYTATLAEIAPDDRFLAIAFGAPEVVLSAERTAVTRRAVAARLTALGLPDRAIALIDQGGTLAPEDRLLLAEAELAADRPRRALDLVTGLESRAAQRLAAEARASAADHAGASALFLALDDSEAGAQAAWRAGDWEAVRDLGDEAQRAMAERLVSRNAFADLPAMMTSEAQLEASLARSREILADSVAARETLTTLLDRIAPPEPLR